jgi:hypothetical protein
MNIDSNLTLNNNDKLISNYSKNMESYKSLISVKAINNIKKDEFYEYVYDSDIFRNKILKYKYEFINEGSYLLNVTYEGNMFSFLSSKVLRIPFDNYKFSLEYSKLQVFFDDKSIKMNIDSNLTLNNNDIPNFKLFLYNLAHNPMSYDEDDEISISCNFTNNNIGINWKLEYLVDNYEIIFSFDNETKIQYKKLKKGNYSLIIESCEQVKIYNLFLSLPDEEEKFELFSEYTDLEHCYVHCNLCNLIYMIIETGECTDNCTIDKFFNGICKIYSDAPLTNKSIIIDKIRNDLLNGKIKSLKIVTLNHNDLLIKDGNIVYQITSSFNQINNKYENISTINLGECERKIRDIYGLDDNEELIIFKIEYYEEKLLIPVIEYEIYHIDKKIKIDLNICKDKDILLSIPVKINESELFKHDPNGGFYNDICYPYTTQFKTDITISDRRNEFKYNNLSLCEKNCQFRGYDSENKKVKCSCNAKNEIRLFEIIDIDKDKLFSKFTDINKLTNIFVIKCYYVFFTKNGFIKNIGSYILLIIILSNIILLIVFLIKGYKELNNI